METEHKEQWDNDDYDEDESLIETTQTVYESYATKYQICKRKTMLNLLECGKILFEVKESLGYGVWCQFLKDGRVSESERTAHRILSIYKNYRHLLSPNYMNKADALSQLGVSHLLELQKLPDRFKKDIEVIREVDGVEKKEIVKVIDEEKLGDFLEQKVEFEGTQKNIRDLPVSEMKKYIKEAKGIFEPDEDVEPDTDKVPELVSEPLPKLNKVIDEETDNTDYSKEFLRISKMVREHSNDLFKLLNNLNSEYFEYNSENKRNQILHEITELNRCCEGIIVKTTDLQNTIQS
jgi:hypothetical protein